MVTKLLFENWSIVLLRSTSFITSLKDGWISTDKDKILEVANSFVIEREIEDRHWLS